jgi:hypothetical protein
LKVLDIVTQRIDLFFNDPALAINVAKPFITTFNLLDRLAFKNKEEEKLYFES